MMLHALGGGSQHSLDHLAAAEGRFKGLGLR